MVKMILLVPAPTVVTTPVEELTIATPVLLLLHVPVPPESTTVLAVYVVVPGTDKGVVPVTEPMLALGLTVRFANEETGEKHPVLTV